MLTEYYKLLELEPDASDDDIKKAYKRMAIKYHPDKNLDDKDAAEAQFKKIGEAYEILCNKGNHAQNSQNSHDMHDILRQMFAGMQMPNNMQMHAQMHHQMQMQMQQQMQMHMHMQMQEHGFVRIIRNGETTIFINSQHPNVQFN